MITAFIDRRHDLGYCRQMVVFDSNSRAYNFVNRKWVDVGLGITVPDECLLTFPEDVYRAITATIKADKTTPSPEKSYLEGKCEILERYLKDVRKVAKI